MDRDMFAIAAMNALIVSGDGDMNVMVCDAYRIADKMMIERDKARQIEEAIIK